MIHNSILYSRIFISKIETKKIHPEAMLYEIKQFSQNEFYLEEWQREIGRRLINLDNDVSSIVKKEPMRGKIAPIQYLSSSDESEWNSQNYNFEHVSHSKNYTSDEDVLKPIPMSNKPYFL